MDHIRLDGRALRILAHPLRARLLSELRLHGAATATTLAVRLSTNTGATSYHLRKLAAVGLVEETGEGHGKQRFWVAAQRSHEWRDADVEGDPDGLAASTWLRQHYWRHYLDKVGRWEEVRADWPLEWRDALTMSDSNARMSAGQLTELMAEIEAVINRHAARAEAEPAGNRQRISLFWHALPTEPGTWPPS
ncbi:MAG TPA: helix-turn-helix domain-containing protein [Actinophytocola sp.]|uniref:winged helix-turn-helix domain-containing protein n=1 Tax=Actinophytocola sp. TaxID=1872138 RepID=UPI002DB7061D|nr:helix-turn-helix domain-containing protein [Actinophytocola sp.]HEU5474062.1 helix-turn-helix domain-containing protein [Actinophytocola sp.]